MDSDKCTTKAEIRVDGEAIENVEHFEYLGACFYGDGNSKREIKRRQSIV